MGFFGGLLGEGLGYLGEKVLGKTKGIDGRGLGKNLGSRFIPFAKGGRVKPRGMRTGGKVKAKARPGRKRKPGRPKKK
jgi:hypothetical protein